METLSAKPLLSAVFLRAAQLKSATRLPKLAGFLLVSLFGSPALFAHPMGNFSINHYARLQVSANSLEIRYLIDLAEIPTFQDMRQFNFSSLANDPAATHYLAAQAESLKQGLSVKSDGQTLVFQSVSREMVFSDGAGGLPTLKMKFRFRANFANGAGMHNLSYSDNNFTDRTGWKEVLVVGDGVSILNSSAPNSDRSQELTNYSTDPLSSPPQQVSAEARFETPLGQPAASRPREVNSALRTAPAEASRRQPLSKARIPTPTAPLAIQRATTSLPPNLVAPPPASSATQPANKSANTPRNRFTQLIATQGQVSFGILLAAALIAAGLGALHALEPGHGKTVVAAYLVGSRGTAKHAIILGVVVTAAHTAGVYLLGALTLYASRYIVPEKLYPWLGAISGLSVAAVGGFLFLRRRTGETGEHSHSSNTKHSHWFFSNPQPRTAGVLEDPSATSKPVERALSLRELCLLGITGGIVPCPAALVVLLSAFSLHRVAFGLFLITAFSSGLAVVLVAAGLSIVYAKRFVARRFSSQSALLRFLPYASSAFMLILGIGITISSLSTVHLSPSFLARDKLLPLGGIILLGLFLGMRHSTDSDHVLAVSTIVSRQKSFKGSAAIGTLWGLGHTITIFLVGTAIIIFGVVIPPRLGLSMEFCVALMLVLLGVLNLTGLMGWVTARLTPTTITPVPRLSGRVRGTLRAAVGNLGLYHSLRPLAVGLVHGLAGSAAVALLVLSTIKDPLWASAYLVIFGVGTTVGMMLMTLAMSAPLIYTGRTSFQLNRYLVPLSGFASMAFGLFLVFRIGFVDGLFTSHVHWIPQ